MRRLKLLKIYFVFFLLIAFLVISNFQVTATYFMATITFNSAIGTVFIIGLIVIMQSSIRLTMLAGTFGVLSYKKGAELEFYLNGIGKLMPATIANMFEKRAKKGVLYFTDNEAKDVTEWLGEQFFNTKGYIGFFVATSLSIGLFGTFAGLMKAVDDMGRIILSLGGDINIAEVMAQFSGPLGGMAIGFSSSLFGVASAIILNFLQYILTRQQASFIEDVQDWLKGKLIEAQSPEVIGKINTSNEDMKSGGVDTSGVGVGTTAFLDIFVDKISELSASINKANQSSELIFKQVAIGLEESTMATKRQAALFEDISKKLQELNTSQYSGTESMISTINAVSDAILSEHSTIKKLLVAQEESNKSLQSLVQISSKVK
jgi:methyl-accepting chemotaxis protein